MSDTGGRPESVSDGEIRRLFRETDERVLTTTEVAAEFGVSRRTALRRLTSLADDGPLRRKNVGERASVWWLPDDPGAETNTGEDPFLAAEPFASGRSDVSASVDDALADSVRSERDG